MLRVKEIKNNNGTIYLDPYYIDYLCFTDASGSSNTLTLTKTDAGNTPAITLEYSTDKVNWTTWTETNNVRTYTIPANGKVYLRGVNPNGICYNGSNCHTFSSTKNVRASGNIMTIADGIGRRTEITRPFFARLFYQMTTLLTAPNFPSEGMSLGDSSLSGMFQGCSSLTTAPSLTVNSLSSGWSCNSMFNGCTSITDASTVHLNATNIPSSAYKLMFSGCTELVTPPEINATTLNDGDGNTDNGSLAYMFQNCSKLNTIKVHFTSWNSGNCTKQWTYGTKSTGTFYKPSSLPSTKNASGNTTNAHYIPYNWTVTNI